MRIQCQHEECNEYGEDDTFEHAVGQARTIGFQIETHENQVTVALCYVHRTDGNPQSEQNL